MYAVSSHDAAAPFLERAEAWLLEREDHNNLVLSLAYAHAARGSEERGALFAIVERGDEVVGCVLRTPPHKALITDLPLAAAPIAARALASRFTEIPAVLGPAPAAEAVARAWVEIRGGGWRPGMEQRIYRLDEVRPIDGVSGSLRLASSDDLELALRWGEGFARDAGVQFATNRDIVASWIGRQVLFIWDDAGVPRSISVASGRTPRGVRIGYVYTPPEFRRAGYASACVGAVSQRMLDDGYDFCVLYTDLGNPTSNAIYRRVGYEALADVRDFDVVP